MLADASIDRDLSARTRLPMKRMSQPDELAAACAFLVCDEVRFITGQTINVNGGRYLGS